MYIIVRRRDIHVSFSTHASIVRAINEIYRVEPSDNTLGGKVESVQTDVQTDANTYTHYSQRHVNNLVTVKPVTVVIYTQRIFCAKFL